ncbi:MAG TPA: cytochrome c [Bryobacteraceae bacterium]|nr:cytochrome c [Bryobacteraceae bacterium]
MRISSLLILGAAVTLAAAAGLVDRVPVSAAQFCNPFANSESARRAGAKLFARECAACHGRHRQGIGKAPPLDQPAVRDAPAGMLFWILRNGSLRRGMPSFAHLPEAQRWQIVTYLKNPAP